ncbi:MAG: cytidylate kinase-like family protein [Bacteroidales bacterium]|nr:cytidylate kinase-like family protein [Bacteroidales bacterium]
MSNLAINIGRSFGSGGHAIGKHIAATLDIPFYDQELIKLAAKKSGLCPECFEKIDERPSRFFDNIFYAANSSGVYGMSGPLSGEKLFSFYADVIKKLSAESSAVFVGRCADYILRDTAQCINIFCYAPLPFRINIVAQRMNISESEAEKLIIKTDKARASYYEQYSDKRWGMAGSYHLLVDTSLFGIEGTAEKLCALFELDSKK